MNRTITFTVLGEPVAKGRPRVMKTVKFLVDAGMSEAIRTWREKGVIEVSI